MKYHRWQKDPEDDERVSCIRCGISMPIKTRPRRITHCPPTWFERELIDRIWYGKFDIATRQFDGLHAISM